jgi:hypothetical protein
MYCAKKRLRPPHLESAIVDNTMIKLIYMPLKDYERLFMAL